MEGSCVGGLLTPRLLSVKSWRAPNTDPWIRPPRHQQEEKKPKKQKMSSHHDKFALFKCLPLSLSFFGVKINLFFYGGMVIVDRSCQKCSFLIK